jgi:hypothetical protein
MFDFEREIPGRPANYFESGHGVAAGRVLLVALA